MNSISSFSSTESILSRTSGGSAEGIRDYAAESSRVSSDSSNRSEGPGVSPRLADELDPEDLAQDDPVRDNNAAESSFRPEPMALQPVSGVVEREVGSSSNQPQRDSDPPPYAPAKRLAKDIPDYVGTTKISKNMLIELYQRCGSPGGVRFLLPTSDERPWTPPNGFVCVYAASFLRCGLRFLIPSFLMEFCEAHRVAISQLTPATIRNAVGNCALPKSPETFYASSTKGFRIVTGTISKTYLWKDRYFFVEKNAAAFENPS